MAKETFTPESEPVGEKMEVGPSDEGMGAENCIVIKEGEPPTLLDIVGAASVNRAMIVDHDEAGDDEYIVQFPGHGQERLMQDGISGRIRESL